MKDFLYTKELADRQTMFYRLNNVSFRGMKSSFRPILRPTNINKKIHKNPFNTTIRKFFNQEIYLNEYENLCFFHIII